MATAVGAWEHMHSGGLSLSLISIVISHLMKNEIAKDEFGWESDHEMVGQSCVGPLYLSAAVKSCVTEVV